ncbi:MAG TPA: prepilin peptidase [Myxococcota bacterium]|jgi:leader peptidase (prepilin peptidase)/N-methyltransferase|nr:prepilin peptidase [Myxococcota bacterium]
MDASPPLGTGLLAGFALAFGLVVGSFLNVVVHRLPRDESIAWPGSRCPRCQTPIAPYDNVPVLSWLLLRGRCRHCGVAIGWRYPALELGVGVLFVAIALRYGPTLETPLWMGFAAALVAAAVIDFEHQIIPDEISLGGLVVGLVAVPALAALAGDDVRAAAARSALGALLGGGILWSVGFAHARVSVALGRRFEHWPGDGEALPRPASLDYWVWFPGLGFGDVKLLAMIGAFVGPVGVVQTLLCAALGGLVLGLAWIAVQRRFDAPFGFAPALALGALLTVLFPGLGLVP